MRPQRVGIIGTTFPSYERHCANWSGMQQGLETLGIEHRLFSCRPDFSIDEVVQFNPDLLIYGLIDMVKNEHWRRELRIKLPKAKIVMWYGDYRDRSTGQIRADMSEIDCMFISNDAQSEWYKRIWKVPRCLYLPLGSPIYTEEYQKRFDFDFVFIGATITGARFFERAKTMWEYRRDHGLKIIDGPVNRPDLREKVFQSMPAIYRSSKICLDQSHFTDAHRYTSNRHWIITASGGFALTKRFPGCELDYPEGTRVYFDTFKESLELRDYYLKHPEEREKIRLAGYQHAQNHTYDKRFARMFGILYASTPSQIDTSTRARSSAPGAPFQKDEAGVSREATRE